MSIMAGFPSSKQSANVPNLHSQRYQFLRSKHFSKENSLLIQLLNGKVPGWENYYVSDFEKEKRLSLFLLPGYISF